MLQAAQRYIRHKLVSVSYYVQYALRNHADITSPLGQQPDFGAPVFERNTVSWPMTLDDGVTYQVTIALIPTVEQQRAYLVAETTQSLRRAELQSE